MEHNDGPVSLEYGRTGALRAKNTTIYIQPFKAENFFLNQPSEKLAFLQAENLRP